MLQRTIRLPHYLAWLVCAALLFVGGSAFAYKPPPLTGAVVDTAGKLTADERRALESRLAAYREKTTNEVVVFFCASLGSETIDDVKFGAFNGWKLGKAEKDNGVLLVIAPNERKIGIETGKGIGDKLTDIESSRILRERVGPLLKQNRFNDAAIAGLDAIEAKLDGRPVPPVGSSSSTPSGSSPSSVDNDVVPRRGPPSDYWIDGASVLTDEEIASLDEAARSDALHWSRLGVVIWPSRNESTANIQKASIARRSSRVADDYTLTGGVTVIVYADERKVSVVAPGMTFGQTSLVESEINSALAKSPKLTRAVLEEGVRPAMKLVDELISRQLLADSTAIAAAKKEAQAAFERARAAESAAAASRATSAPPPSPSPDASWFWIFLALIVGFMVLVIIASFRRRRSGWASGSSSSGSDSWSSGSDYSSSSSSWSSGGGSSFDSSSSSSSTSDFSGGGGASGGGGSSDSY